MKQKIIIMFLCLCGGFLAQAQNISGVNPAQNPALEGSALFVTISGNNTNFNQGSGTTIYADVGGTNIGGIQFGPATNTNMNAVLQIPCGVCGNATLYVHNNVDGLMSFPNAFDVTCAQINSVNPSSISSGQTLPIGISGTGINFAQGSSTVYFRNNASGQIINPSSYNGFTQDSANVDLSIPANYSCNATLDACVYTSTGCQVCLPNAITVVGTGQSPQITGLSPNSGRGGRLLDVTISGTNTDFTQGSSVFFQLISPSSGATANPVFVNPQSSNQINVSFFLPSVCGTYDLHVYGLDPCSTQPLIYPNAFNVTSLFIPEVSIISPSTGSTQQTVTMSLQGYNIDFVQNGSSMLFNLVHATTGANLFGTNLVPNSGSPWQTTIDFNPGANDCGVYHLVIDSVPTGCGGFTTIIDSNSITINSTTNPQIQSLAPSNTSIGSSVSLTVVAPNLDFNFVNVADVRLQGFYNSMSITPVSLVPNASNPNEAVLSFNVPNNGFYCDFYDLIIENVSNCGMTTVTLFNQFEVYCPVGGIEPAPSEISVRVYPNPMDQEATIEITSDEHQDLQFHLFDLLGRELRTANLESNSNFYLQRNGLPSGMYIYKLLDQHGEMLKIGRLELR